MQIEMERWRDRKKERRKEWKKKSNWGGKRHQVHTLQVSFPAPKILSGRSSINQMQAPQILHAHDQIIATATMVVHILEPFPRVPCWCQQSIIPPGIQFGFPASLFTKIIIIKPERKRNQNPTEPRKFLGRILRWPDQIDDGASDVKIRLDQTEKSVIL